MTSNFSQQQQSEVRAMGGDKFGVFKIHGGAAVDCVAEYSGPCSYEHACREAVRLGAPWSSNVPGKLPQAQSNLAELPFMAVVDGNVVIYHGSTVDRLDDSWTGVCCDAYGVKSFWHIGRDHRGERTFDKLMSANYLQAVQEARDLLTARRAFETYSGAQSLVRVDSDRYASIGDAQDALTKASLTVS
ncbi:hypothetical protein [Cupriavidus sp. UYPR2.512]|uniref:hypothetical protein n=1 Tax=Cupriavidus sp. UYPR2.512 TaxID=1080187 RepID=UPI000378F986|nr:hypothetical protein [Cupriavidus sp. UYPR2.512]UIF89180.1 hypothetical protein KAF44_29770 [Cupriavidus necator]